MLRKRLTYKNQHLPPSTEKNENSRGHYRHTYTKPVVADTQPVQQVIQVGTPIHVCDRHHNPPTPPKKNKAAQ